MARTLRGGAPAADIDPLARVADDIDYDLSYSQILARNGAYRVGSEILHKLPIGVPIRQGGKWVQQTKAYPVAMSAKEARIKTRDTGTRHDYYEAGARCKRCAEAGSGGLVSGWVLGGRKFQSEHDHVTNYDPAVITFEEVDAPVDDDAEPAAVLVEA